MSEENQRHLEAEARRLYRVYYVKYGSDTPVAEIQEAYDNWREAERAASPPGNGAVG